jgi:hypothetical protein
MTILLTFLILFALKHYLADRNWQTMWMVQGKRLPGFQFVVPLGVHALIHAGLTGYVVMAVGILIASWPMILLAPVCAAFDFICHFTMDRIKGVATNPKLKISTYIPASTIKLKTWMIVDQMVHGLTYLAIIVWLIGSP